MTSSIPGETTGDCQSLHRVTVELDERQLRALRWIAQQKRIKMSQALKYAIEPEGYLLDRHQQGAHILVESPFGKKKSYSHDANGHVTLD